jgi:hypothetical protein
MFYMCGQDGRSGAVNAALCRLAITRQKPVAPSYCAVVDGPTLV